MRTIEDCKSIIPIGSAMNDFFEEMELEGIRFVKIHLDDFMSCRFMNRYSFNIPTEMIMKLCEHELGQPDANCILAIDCIKKEVIGITCIANGRLWFPAVQETEDTDMSKRLIAVLFMLASYESKKTLTVAIPDGVHYLDLYLYAARITEYLGFNLIDTSYDTQIWDYCFYDCDTYVCFIRRELQDAYHTRYGARTGIERIEEVIKGND